MITRGMLKEYLKYIVPTMITFTLGGVYSIIDGVFVGHAVGDAGLAGINVAFPLVAFSRCPPCPSWRCCSRWRRPFASF